MNIVVTDLPTAVRIELLDLDAMPYDRRAIEAARRDLSTRDYGVWTKLRERIWEYGSLPANAKALAKIAGIGETSFVRAAPKLARHFDPGPHGTWTDDFLMENRGSSLVVPSPEPRGVRPEVSAARALAGGKGGRARAANAAAKTGGGLLQVQANFQANGLAAPASKTAGGGDGFACLAPGWLVGSDPLFRSKTNQPTAGASEAKPAAAPQANGGQANGGQANGGQAKVDEAPDRDAPLVQAMMRVCPGKLDAATARWGLKIVKEWIAKGVGFELDYLPVLRTWASTNSVVKNAANSRIQEAVFAARAERLAGAGGGATRPDLAGASAETRALHAALEAALGADTYVAWCGRLAMVDGGPAELARLAVPTKFLKTWLDGNFARELLAAARTVRAGVTAIAVEVRPAPS